MSFKTNVIQEAAFVKLYLKTGDAVDAVTRSGLIYGQTDPRDMADELLANPRIQDLIAAQQPPTLRRPSEISRESIISDYERVFGAAMIKEDYGNAIAAKKGQSAVLGFNQENVQVTHKMDVTRMTDEQLINMIALKSKREDLRMIDITPVGLGQIKSTATTSI